MATVIGEPSETILTVERRPASNGSRQAAACGVASCAKETRRFEPTAAATPAAAPETNLRRLREDPLILPQMFIDVHLLQLYRFHGPMRLRHAQLRACTIY